MSRRVEDEEYEFSLMAEDAIRLYWPDALTSDHPRFAYRMVELQLALIEGHMRVMYPSDLRRAQKTIKLLKRRLKDG